MTYSYDGYNNVTYMEETTSDTSGTTAISTVGTHYEYDSYGNNTKISVQSGGTTKVTEYIYEEDGNRLRRIVDPEGNITKYGYSSDTGLLRWIREPNDTEDTETWYYYDSMHQLEKVSKANVMSTSTPMQVTYGYTNDRLTQIRKNYTTYSFSYDSYGNRTKAWIDSRTLAEYTYSNDGNHLLTGLDYGNGDGVRYTYDDEGRLTRQTYTDDGNYVAYKYNNTGALAQTYNSRTGITTLYYYDDVGRLTRRAEVGDSETHAISYTYDANGNVTARTETINGASYIMSYTYDAGNRVTRTSCGRAVTDYTYGAFNRLTARKIYDTNNAVLTNTITYRSGSDQVASLRAVTGDGTTITYSYDYDANGNVTSVSDGTYTTTYVYDKANQLVRENNEKAGKTWCWRYNTDGNIHSKAEYAYTTGTLGASESLISYGYGSTIWGDLLTRYGDATITYDTIGNPLSDGTWDYTWQHGRQLASMESDTATWNFTYNTDGLRTKRVNGSTQYRYWYNDLGQLTKMTYGDTVMKFSYDTNGLPVSFCYNETWYYYVLNLQGDVIGIVNGSGVSVATYIYDAWGRVITAAGGTVAQQNPLRYRGYIYDWETKLYYVSSRYYNPTIGRWINADTTDILTATPMALTDKNLFAYCDNNPVMREDHSGQFWESAFDVISLGASIVEVCVNPTDLWAWAGLVGDTVDLIPFLTGVGEATRAVKTTVKVVDKATDVLDTANDLYKAVDAADDIRKATGSYEIVYKSGKSYIGKGGFKRAITSAKQHAESVDDILAIRWKSAPNARDAFIDEYLMQKRFGGVLSSSENLLTHNKIWSPGRKYYVG